MQIISINGRDIFLRGNIENPKKIVFFVHGFGSSEIGGNLGADIYSDGFVPALGESLGNDTLVVSFNFADTKEMLDENLGKTVKRQYFPSISHMMEILGGVIKNIREQYPNSNEVSFIGHSMGSLVVLGYLNFPSLKNLEISKIMLLAMPTRPNSERMRKYFMEKEGSYTKDGVDYLKRSDGSQTVVDQSFWNEQDELNVFQLLQTACDSFSNKIDFVLASRDLVLYPELADQEEIAIDLLKEHYLKILDMLNKSENNFVLFNMEGNEMKGHDFQGIDNAEILLKYIVERLNNTKLSAELSQIY